MHWQHGYLLPLLAAHSSSTYHFTHLLIHSVWLQVWSDRKWIRYGCVLLLYILCVLWILFYTLHFLYLVLFLSLSDNSSLVANVICLLKPTWNKVYLILSYLILGKWQWWANCFLSWSGVSNLFPLNIGNTFGHPPVHIMSRIPSWVCMGTHCIPNCPFSKDCNPYLSEYRQKVNK